MKILHTSDWHLGHSLYGFDRTEEQEAMLRQMVDIVKQHKPDVFLLSGDVFHTSQPSSAVQTSLSKALVDLHQANPDMVIVMTAGNHDSGSKHEIFRIPWLALNVYAIGQLNKEQPEEHIIEVPGKGYVVAVPYVNERNLPDDFYPALLDKVKERNTAGLPVVLSAHTTVKGCEFTGHSQATDLTVGGIDAIDIARLGDGYDYMALGHIHRPQFLHGSEHRARYCGSPLAVSFDECYAHSVSLVEIDRHGDTPTVETIEIDNSRPLVSLPTNGFASWDEAKRLLEQFPDDNPAYIRLNVEVDDFLPPAAQSEASQIADKKSGRFCHINAKRKVTGHSTDDTTLTVQSLQEASPLEIAQLFAKDKGFPFSEELQSLFKKVIDEVAEDNRNA